MKRTDLLLATLIVILSSGIFYFIDHLFGNNSRPASSKGEYIRIVEITNRIR